MPDTIRRSDENGFVREGAVSLLNQASGVVAQGVLVVDDDKLVRTATARVLEQRGFKPVAVPDAPTALQLLHEPGAPRVVLIDWEMPAMSGPEFCRIVRASKALPYVYVLLTTGREGRRPFIEAMNSGADGYICKPVDADELEAWLLAGRRIVDLHDRLLAVQGELEKRALYDGLTSLKNRGATLDCLRNELSRATRSGSHLTIALVDVDHFKQVNDGHGHQVGDEVLQEVARRGTASVRAYDMLGRWGGEEFLVVLPQCELAHGRIVAARLLRAFAEPPVATTAGPLRISVSIGIASTEQGYRAEAVLLEAADKALYAAKREGRNRAREAPNLRRSPFPPAR